MIIFSTEKNIKLLANSKQLHADGTFKCSPQNFQQMFTIHSIVNGNLLPLIYVVSLKKSANIYDRVLDIILEKEPSFNPETLIMDFDQAQLKSFVERFPLLIARGCYFHFKMCLIKKMKETKELYSKFIINEDSFGENFKKIFALCFLPKDDIVTGYELLMDTDFFTSVAHYSIISVFLNYFERVWIGVKIGNSNNRFSPLYNHEVWSQNYAVLNDIDRTNNKVEGFHHGFKTMMGCDNSTIWSFIDNIKREQAITEIKILQGFDSYPTKLTRDQKLYDQRLKRVVSSYDNQDIMSFLNIISTII